MSALSPQYEKVLDTLIAVHDEPESAERLQGNAIAQTLGIDDDEAESLAMAVIESVQDRHDCVAARAAAAFTIGVMLGERIGYGRGADQFGGGL